jgi:FecR protein
MRGHRFFLSLVCLLLTGACLPLAKAQSSTGVVRLSYTQGQVSILQGDETQFEQAQANMPLLAGYSIETGHDGQAELEFLDGSVARLTPQSRLQLIALPGRDTRGETTDMELVSGLGYFELNTQYGQSYRVRFHGATANPEQNSIFRVSLDRAPELAVFAGTVHAKAANGFDQSLNQGSMVQLPSEDDSGVQVAQRLRQDSWDQWNQDRDDQIAREAQEQTSARESAGAQNEPGWNDLDYYGDWYPVEGYGNVWAPNNVPAGWDPYANGYWANYPGWGYTWISAYPWGWLPYNCGAWNYWNSFGWGWIPGQCGLGWQSTIVIWNHPNGYRPPPRPIPGGHANQPAQLVAVNRGPVLNPGMGLTNHHTKPVRIEGQRVEPLPVLRNNAAGSRYSLGLNTTGRSRLEHMPGGTPGSAPTLGDRTSPVVGRGYGYVGRGGPTTGVPKTVVPAGGGGNVPGSSGLMPSGPRAGVPGTGTVQGTGVNGSSPRPIFRPSPIQSSPMPSAPVISPVRTPPVGVTTAPAPRPAPVMQAPRPAPVMQAPRPVGPSAGARTSAPSPSAPHMGAPGMAGHH